MHINATHARPAPNPTWAGVTLAEVKVSTFNAAALFSIGALGRAGGYESEANAMRAARQLTRGDERDAAAVLSHDGRYFVQALQATDALWGRWDDRLNFEHALPAILGPGRISEHSKVRAQVDGLLAIVDGARQLRIV